MGSDSAEHIVFHSEIIKESSDEHVGRHHIPRRMRVGAPWASADSVHKVKAQQMQDTPQTIKGKEDVAHRGGDVSTQSSMDAPR